MTEATTMSPMVPMVGSTAHADNRPMIYCVGVLDAPPSYRTEPSPPPRALSAREPRRRRGTPHRGSLRAIAAMLVHLFKA